MWVAFDRGLGSVLQFLMHCRYGFPGGLQGCVLGRVPGEFDRCAIGLGY